MYICLFILFLKNTKKKKNRACHNINFKFLFFGYVNLGKQFKIKVISIKYVFFNLLILFLLEKKEEKKNEIHIIFIN